jgi:hypothetical protein
MYSSRGTRLLLLPVSASRRSSTWLDAIRRRIETFAGEICKQRSGFLERHFSTTQSGGADPPPSRRPCGRGGCCTPCKPLPCRQCRWARGLRRVPSTLLGASKGLQVRLRSGECDQFRHKGGTRFLATSRPNCGSNDDSSRNTGVQHSVNPLKPMWTCPPLGIYLYGSNNASKPSAQSSNVWVPRKATNAVFVAGFWLISDIERFGGWIPSSSAVCRHERADGRRRRRDRWARRAYA